MERLFRRLTPNWLQKLDHRLLLNDPILWATRIHHVIFWALCGLGLAALYGYFLPFGERQVWILGIGTVVLAIGSLIGFCFWWSVLLRYPAWQQAKKLKGWLSIRNMMVFLLGASLLSAIPIVFFELGVQAYVHVSDWVPTNAHFLTPSQWFIQEINDVQLWQTWALVGLPLLWLLTEMSAYMKTRQFWMTFGGAIGISCVIGLILDALGPGKDTALPLFIVMFLVAQVRFLVEWVYEDNPAKEHAIWAQVIFLGLSSLHIWILPVAILIAFQMNIYIPDAESAFLGRVGTWIFGIALSLFMWHRYFRPKVLDLYLQPPE